jgi:hypothetical protein
MSGSGERSIDPRAEQRRLLSSKLVLALHHLIKACILYRGENHAVTSMTAAVSAAVADLAALGDAPHARVLVADELIFVNGRILKGPREASSIGHELAGLLARAGIAELTFDRGVPAESIAAFARAVAGAAHDPAAARAVLEGQVAGVSARWVDPTAVDALPEIDRASLGRVVQGYAAAVVRMRRALEGIERGDLGPAARSRRVAQALVALVEEQPEVLAALATAAFPDGDPARVAVSTAVVALLMARRLVDDPRALASLAAAALLADAGRIRLGDMTAARDRFAASALVALTALGRLDPAGAAPALIAYEALRLAYGPPLAGREPLVLARVLHTARRFNELRVPAAGAPGAGVDVAVEVLRASSADPGARVYLDLLVSGLGFFPLGTLVRLSTGEIAVVMGVPAASVDFAQPEVLLLADARGVLVNRRVDLARPAPGQPKRTVARALPADRAALGKLYARMAAPRPRVP